ncbi:hypothetical protein GGP41_005496 [Bipolaris sorokiniana]|uniref:NADAR domain-containing protein n=2 Tax=Cochliobolus sativus TaxID=45130 RepID=A0A8H5ZH48_COCSA|nr:uncharacterized protein COCSADRAFT_37630 [Bipolaris sorokiniana ND90Pr]EMD63893.1 hypothetical protein COCSADRAFT_37630 [Bipolaris sorokiniana ND90Pr]KAF5848119.1 hypothetical protein GGP41_005496 [Bipolaris sorokiniana]
MPKAKSKSKKPATRAARPSARSEAGNRGRQQRSITNRSTVQEPTEDGDRPVFFWKETERDVGFLSPWYTCVFKESGVRYTSVGHSILAEKARLFGDNGALNQILAADTAKEQKLWGGNIKGINDKIWEEHALGIATRANIAKFFVSGPLKERLESFGTREFVLASPHDRLFGIGFNAADAIQLGKEQWGQNLFGQALHITRSQLDYTLRSATARQYDELGVR